MYGNRFPHRSTKLFTVTSSIDTSYMDVVPRPSGDGTDPGLLALVGGNEWRNGCTFDREIVASQPGAPVVVIPTAAAFEGPKGAVATATAWFASLGATVEICPIYNRPDAFDPMIVEQLRHARILYFSGGSAMHLMSVMQDSPAWSAARDSWKAGATLAASSAGAMVLADPMIDQRGGAFTLGLGLLPGIAVLPHANTWSAERMRRTQKLAGVNVSLLAIDEETAALREPGGTWKHAGKGNVLLHRTGEGAPHLPGLPTR